MDEDDEILSLFSQAEAFIFALICRLLAKDIDKEDWAKLAATRVREVRLQVQDAALQLQRRGNGILATALLSAYERGVKDATTTTKALPSAVRNPKADLPTQLKGFNPRLSLLNGEARTAISGLALQIPSSASNIYSEVIAQAVANMSGPSSLTRKQAALRAVNTWSEKGVTGFVDRRGRQWSLSSYAEMATRTASNQAAVFGYADRLVESGYDLVIVSDATEECDRCRPWEGKILSVSGTSKQGRMTKNGHSFTVAGTLAEARAAGLFHPNCRHRTVLFLPGYTAIPTNTADPEGNKLRVKQRAYERRIRTLKVGVENARTLTGVNSPELTVARKKLHLKQQEFKSWRDANNRTVSTHRTNTVST